MRIIPRSTRCFLIDTFKTNFVSMCADSGFILLSTRIYHVKKLWNVNLTYAKGEDHVFLYLYATPNRKGLDICVNEYDRRTRIWKGKHLYTLEGTELTPIWK